jgi:hypothetical protein
MSIGETPPYSEAFTLRQVPLSTSDTLPLPESRIAESIFQLHTPAVSGPVNLETITTFQPYWILLGSMAIIAIILNLTYKYYANYFIGYFAPKMAGDYSERENKFGIIPRLINLVFIFNLALFLHKTFPYLGIYLPFDSSLQDMMIFTGVVFILWLVKTLVTVLIHSVFSNYTTGIQLLKINQQAEYVLSIILIPINFVLYYTFSDILIVSGLMLVVLFILLWGVIKLFFTIKDISSFYSYQIFIYLCTLEILPVFVIVRYYFMHL